MRKKCNYTQQELAEKLYISDSVISKWERGESSPSLDLLIGIAEIYDMTLSELIGDDDTLREVKNYWGRSCYRKRLPVTVPVAIIEVITSVFFVVMLAYSIYLYLGLPDQVFTLFNSEGIGVGEGPKSVAWILLGTSIFCYVLFTLVQIIPFRLSISLLVPIYLDEYVQRTDHFKDIRAKSSLFWAICKLLLVLILLPTALPLLLQEGASWMFTATMVLTAVFVVYTLVGIGLVLWKCREYYFIEQVEIKARRDAEAELVKVDDNTTPILDEVGSNTVLVDTADSCVQDSPSIEEVITDEVEENIVTDGEDTHNG